jgi:hypothetical protein
MHAVYPQRGAAGNGKEALMDSITATIAVIAAIYEYSADSRRRARRLSQSELEGGMFKEGARELRFIDGRPPRNSLAVTAADVAATIKALQAAKATGAEG